jgi:hypothetical protein
MAVGGGGQIPKMPEYLDRVRAPLTFSTATYGDDRKYSKAKLSTQWITEIRRLGKGSMVLLSELRTQPMM